MLGHVLGRRGEDQLGVNFIYLPWRFEDGCRHLAAHRLLKKKPPSKHTSSVPSSGSQLERGQRQGRALKTRDLWAEDETGVLDV